ncbi:hypothetical protein EJ06DRAFT_557423 [Trichodelitschia bisporula]|uniref:EF-hand domain-containing protein n=1 Tax=Trichodelitschia bisporula TaxID=703511 RepID=A0A6G1HV85_9PEZI|nr:hypothetical protein EJ06DRAFT_557423 [Trichodelitschia bisporula]
MAAPELLSSNQSSPLKPAPLSFNSPRASPFRRPESPLARSPSTIRASTPQPGSPLKQSTPTPSPTKGTPTQSPTKLSSPAPLRPFNPTAKADTSWLTTRGSSLVPSPPGSPTKSPSPTPFRANANSQRPEYASSPRPEYSPSPRLEPPAFGTPTSRPLPVPHAHSSPAMTSSPSTIRNAFNPNDPMSKIPPQHLHTMRESFAVLDRANTGMVTPGDVAQQLSELGLDASPAALAAYFSGSGQQSVNLATYLNLLASDLAQLSRQDELLAAFSAFDDDDSGQVDVAELRDALLHAIPEHGSGDRALSEREIDKVMNGYVGRRAFKKGQSGAGLGGKKEVFRYGDFVAGIWGGNGEPQQPA